jgi:hypothetical protein
MKLALIYTIFVVTNSIAAFLFYSPYWISVDPTSPISLVNNCDGIITFSHPTFQKLFAAQTIIATVFHAVLIRYAMGNFLHLKSIGAVGALVLIPFFAALTILKLEPFFTPCVS